MATAPQKGGGGGNEKSLLLSPLVTAASKEGERAWLSIPPQMARALSLHTPLLGVSSSVGRVEWKRRGAEERGACV